ncbi:hypothetical protein BB560_006771 [Smittium megazygosporum]|uniref:SANTA domain-containing protein n=1 Tax=Smittium megazygosporum TaxID=133381 RepID=A0A2T9Y1X3_9FUNG|nr:hypothetical protein BB560_006771 [Smittium megazygosporum]
MDHFNSKKPFRSRNIHIPNSSRENDPSAATKFPSSSEFHALNYGHSPLIPSLIPGSYSTRPIFIGQEDHYSSYTQNNLSKYNPESYSSNSPSVLNKSRNSNLDRLSAILNTPRSRRPLLLNGTSNSSSLENTKIIKSFISVQELPPELEELQSNSPLEESSKGGFSIKHTLSKWRISFKKTKFKFRDTEEWIIVQGYPKSNIESDSIYSTTFVDSSLGQRTIKTSSGSVFLLDGDPDLLFMLESGYSNEFLSAFKHGFPENWEQVVDAEIQNRILNFNCFGTSKSKKNSSLDSNHSNRSNEQNLEPLNQNTKQKNQKHADFSKRGSGFLSEARFSPESNSPKVASNASDLSDTRGIKPRRISRELKQLTESAKEFLGETPKGKRAASLKALENQSNLFHLSNEMADSLSSSQNDSTSFEYPMTDPLDEKTPDNKSEPINRATDSGSKSKKTQASPYQPKSLIETPTNNIKSMTKKDIPKPSSLKHSVPKSLPTAKSKRIERPNLNKSVSFNKKTNSSINHT